MNEYLENLRNTQGKKSPTKLPNFFSKINMTLLNQSPEKTVKINTFQMSYVPESDEDFEDEFIMKEDLNKFDKSKLYDSDHESSNESSENELSSEDKLEPLKVELSPKKIETVRRSSILSVNDIKIEPNEDGYELKEKNSLDESHEKAKQSNSPTINRISARRSLSTCRKEYEQKVTYSKNMEILKKTQIKYCEAQNRKSLTDTQNWTKIFILVSIFIMFFGVCTYQAFQKETILKNQSDKEAVYREKFKSFIELLKSKYPNQTNLFWANIQSTYRHSILKSKDPSIVLIVSDELTKNLGSNLAHDILNSVKASIEENSHNLNDLIINPKTDVQLKTSIESKNNDKVKLQIDTRLNRIFDNGQRIAMVKNINLIPATSMLLFYTYGDDLLSAKYPGVIILMTLELEEIIGSNDNLRENLQKSQSKLTGYVEDYLFNIWSKQVGEDQLRPLFTRIANNVVLVNYED